jgi:hypothetical protein
MNKLIVAGLLIGSFLSGAVPAMAQIQGGIGDPLTLARDGVMMPFFTGGILGTVATLQVASPVGDNPDLHMFFFDASCQRINIAVGMPLTANDIAFQQIGSAQGGPVATGTNGLITIAGADASGFTLLPLSFPIHSRLYQFSAIDGRSRVLEPIILQTAEFPSVAHAWSPLRSGATFFAPPQTATVQTDLVLICPVSTIQGASGAAFGQDPGGTGNTSFTDTGFPQINPRFPSIGQSPSNNMRVRVYDTNEVFKRDFTIACHCIEGRPSIAVTVNSIYADPNEVPFGTYTELTTVPAGATINAGPRYTFTGYTSTFTVGSAINAFFARLDNGSQLSIDGPAVVSER